MFFKIFGLYTGNLGALSAWISWIKLKRFDSVFSISENSDIKCWPVNLTKRTRTCNNVNVIISLLFNYHQLRKNMSLRFFRYSPAYILLYYMHGNLFSMTKKRKPHKIVLLAKTNVRIFIVNKWLYLSSKSHVFKGLIPLQNFNVLIIKSFLKLMCFIYCFVNIWSVSISNFQKKISSVYDLPFHIRSYYDSLWWHMYNNQSDCRLIKII